MVKMLRRLPATLLAAILLSPLAARAPTLPPQPALWEVKDADTTIWLFGTIHALPVNYHWRDAALDRVFDDADELVLETVLDDKDPAQIAMLLNRLGRTPGLPPLLDRMPSARRAKLAALIKRSGIPLALLDQYETWAAGLMLFGVTLKDVGADGAGIEPVLKALFDARHRPISGLETPEQQLSYLDSLPAPAQRDFVTSELDDPAASRKEFGAMLAAWSRGDDQAIARAFDKEMGDSPALRAALLDRRNTAWAEWIAKRMARPGKLLVAVGAGHLAGPHSVVALLRAKGLAVTRVQ